MSRSILIEGGCVLSLDPAIGEHVGGSVLVQGEKIVAAGPRVDPPPDTERIRRR